MMKAKVVWATPNMTQMITDMARVSNPANQGTDGTKLLKYLLKHKHVSPFEMANVCMEVVTTRDIARQILRHRSFSFQEFSQRYAEVNDFTTKEARLQDLKNRQNSLPTDNNVLASWWYEQQEDVLRRINHVYKRALQLGIAKEVARAILPEGLTVSHMYMNGTVRSWIHYLVVRMAEGTQQEHRDLATLMFKELITVIPELESYILEQIQVQPSH